MRRQAFLRGSLVGVGVTSGIPSVAVGSGVGDCVAVTVADGSGVLAVAVIVGVAELSTVAVTVASLVGVGDCVAVGVFVASGVDVGDAVIVGSGDSVAVGSGVGVS